MNIDYPFHFANRGRTAATDDNDHIRDMIEEFLLTSPGERVNRRDCERGLLQHFFAPNSPGVAAALQFTIKAGLQHWLGDLIEVKKLEVESVKGELRIEVQYVIRRTQESVTNSFMRSIAQ